jgi:hypothetical protein
VVRRLQRQAGEIWWLGRSDYGNDEDDQTKFPAGTKSR